MPKGDKYKALTNFLLNSDSEIVELTFKDLEKITGGLPPSVYKYRVAWSDSSKHSFCYGWLRAGYSIKADFINQRAVFRKVSYITELENTKSSKRNNNSIEKVRKLKKIVTFTITANDVNRASEMVKSNPVYGTEGEALARIIRRFPRNTSIDDVIIKLALIDVTHSTQIFKHKQKATIVQLAQNIVNIENIDNRLKKGDLDLVNEIASSTSVNFLSIASKYCACHNQFLYQRDDYFKYDGVVSNQIQYKVRDYLEYCARLDKIIDENNLRGISGIRQKFDHYFWFENRKTY